MKLSLGLDNKRKPKTLKIAYQETYASSMISERLCDYLSHVPITQNIVIVCVGTDRSTGDSLGPLVGTSLQQKGLPVKIYGTLQDPVHAVNLQETLGNIMNNHKHPFIIAVDACLGQLSSVGFIQLCDGPVKPGAGVHKDLPPIGDIHLTGIVNVSGFMEYFVLQNTRLSLVFQMADVIASAITQAIQVMQPKFTAFAAVSPGQSLTSLRE